MNIGLIMEADIIELGRVGRQIEKGNERTLSSVQKYYHRASDTFPCPVIGISGVSNSGKTTVMTKLIAELSSCGLDIGTIKHDGHDHEMDHPGKDTYLHRSAGAKTVAIVSRNKYSMIRETPSEEVSVFDLIEAQKDMDLIFVEGYKFLDIPKFEVVRKERSSAGVCPARTLLGYITDLESIEPEIPTYGFDELDDVLNVIKMILTMA